MIDSESAWEQVKDLPNVCGVSEETKKRVKESEDGAETDEDVVRIYVEKKVPTTELASDEIVPETLDDTATDVVEIGRVRREDIRTEATEGKKEKVRPVVSGVSIGNWGITAGTLGWLYKKTGKDQVLFGSNAHVFCEKTVENEQSETRVVQPGKLDGGETGDQVAEYVWHDVIEPGKTGSSCRVASKLVKFFNSVASILGRDTRLEAVKQGGKNRIDFALAEPLNDTDYEATFFDIDSYGGYVAGGHLFAGSDKTTIFCKMSNVVEASDAEPLKLDWRDPETGDEVRKTGRTTCDTSGEIVDGSATVRVHGYGGSYADFKDVAIAGSMSTGGDSGSLLLIKDGGNDEND